MHQLLIVEDEPPIRRAFVRWFKRLDQVTVTVAENAEDALALIEDGYEPTSVLSDYNMGRMNGLDFLTAVEARFPHATLVLCSGNEDALELCKDRGVKHLLKPAQTADIQAALGI